MKIDVTQPLYRLDGRELTTQTDNVEFCNECIEKLQSARKSFTFRLVCTQALTAITQESQSLTGQQKFERGELARKIYNEKEPSLDPDDLKLLKDVIGKVQGPLVVFQAYEILKGEKE